MELHHTDTQPCCRYQTWTLVGDDPVGQVWVLSCPSHGQVVGAEVQLRYPGRDEAPQKSGGRSSNGVH